MRAIGIVIIGLALVLAASVFFVVPRLMRSPAPSQQASQPVQVPAKEVLVAAHNLPAGTALKAEDMRWQKWPADGLNPNYFLHDQGDDPKNHVGMIVLHGLETGEPIVQSRLLKPGDTSFMAAELPPGMRAISIHIDNISATSGFILPGDYVDVLLSEHFTLKQSQADQKRSDQIGPPPFDTREINSIVLRDVKVLAIDQTVQDLDSKPKTGGSATLEVTLQDAQKLTIASSIGNLSLLLRSHQLPAHPEAEPTPTIVEDYQVSTFRAAMLQQYLSRLAQYEGGGGVASSGGELRIYHGDSLAGTR
ncbi:MAG TPA: Flp pilus assembly protein CpaB [Stellaceae bacterium]|nr:Flp pilus assembly protein CpaB [Stellaceae bacterium]